MGSRKLSPSLPQMMHLSVCFWKKGNQSPELVGIGPDSRPAIRCLSGCRHLSLILFCLTHVPTRPLIQEMGASSTSLVFCALVLNPSRWPITKKKTSECFLEDSSNLKALWHLIGGMGSAPLSLSAGCELQSFEGPSQHGGSSEMSHQSCRENLQRNAGMGSGEVLLEKSAQESVHPARGLREKD